MVILAYCSPICPKISVMDNKEYEQLKTDVELTKQNITSMSEKIERIHKAVVGDNEYGQEGIVQMVRKHEKWIDKQKYMYAKIYGGVTVVGILWTLIIKFWDKLFN